MDEIARWLLILMPFTFAAKTLTVLGATWIQTQQSPKYRLGWYIFLFFIALTLTSASLTGVFGALAWAFHDEPDLAKWLWVMIPAEVFSWLVAIFGVLMVREERRTP